MNEFTWYFNFFTTLTHSTIIRNSTVGTDKFPCPSTSTKQSSVLSQIGYFCTLNHYFVANHFSYYSECLNFKNHFKYHINFAYQFFGFSKLVKILSVKSEFSIWVAARDIPENTIMNKAESFKDKQFLSLIDISVFVSRTTFLPLPQDGSDNARNISSEFSHLLYTYVTEQNVKILQ